MIPQDETLPNTLLHDIPKARKQESLSICSPSLTTELFVLFLLLRHTKTATQSSGVVHQKMQSESSTANPQAIDILPTCSRTPGRQMIFSLSFHLFQYQMKHHFMAWLDILKRLNLTSARIDILSVPEVAKTFTVHNDLIQARRSDRH